MARNLAPTGMGMQGMLKEGHKQMSGLEEATYKNIEAAK